MKKTDLLQKESIYIRQIEMISHIEYMQKILKSQKELKFRLDTGIKAI